MSDERSSSQSILWLFQYNAKRKGTEFYSQTKDQQWDARRYDQLARVRPLSRLLFGPFFKYDANHGAIGREQGNIDMHDSTIFR
jgi:hypothetical protein